MAAVFDGHGLLGEVAAEMAVETLKAATSQMDWAGLEADPQQFMKELFQRLDAAVTAAHDQPPAAYTYTSGSSTLNFELRGEPDPELGPVYVCVSHAQVPPRPVDFGCTAVVAVCYGSHLVVGNAGDAGGVLIDCQMPDCEDRDGFKAEIFTGKHTATNEAEQERVNRDYPRAAVFTPDGYLAPTDPALSQYELQLTRSLGHRLLRQAGVVAEPDVFVTHVDSEHTYGMVICSDGVMDELQPSDILDRVVNAATAQEASETLCRDAQDFCMDSSKVDDTTALVVLFHDPRRRGEGQ